MIYGAIIGGMVGAIIGVILFLNQRSRLRAYFNLVTGKPYEEVVAHLGEPLTTQQKGAILRCRWTKILDNKPCTFTVEFQDGKIKNAVQSK